MITTILIKIRDLLGDNFQPSFDIRQYNGVSKVYTLNEANVESTSLKVYKNQTLWASSNYSFDSVNVKVTITGTLVAGDNLEFDYNYYEKYSNAVLIGYTRAALTYLATDKYKVFVLKSDDIIFPTPTEAEEHLISLIATILIKPPITRYQTPELTIDFTEKETKEEKIKRVLRQFKKTYGVTKYVQLDKDSIIDKEDE